MMVQIKKEDSAPSFSPIHFIYIAHFKNKVSNSKKFYLKKRKSYKHNKSAVTYNTDKIQQERRPETT